MKHGDFTGLGEVYDSTRPDYSEAVIDIAPGLIGKNINQIEVADVGAGTGIWTRMLAQRQFDKVYAVEPNGDMRNVGEGKSNLLNFKHIKWIDGRAEKTNLSSESLDWVTMASSFHWADFDQATLEFHRILRKRGYLTALWNPRVIEDSPILLDIEAEIENIKPNIKRVSSGKSQFTDNLTNKLATSPFFEDVVYLESKHNIIMPTERYLGIWRSVNDLRVQLGEANFEIFLKYVNEKTKNIKVIEATYLTRAWFARRKD
jgi:ubiquinone/menaquinone biosynthesis C-methylase UbiE